MLIFFLSVFLFLMTFAAVAMAVLFFRANLITQNAEKHAEESEAEARKFEEAYLKIKNAPKIALENAMVEASRIVGEAETKGKAIVQEAEQTKASFIAEGKAIVQEAEQTKANFIAEGKETLKEADLSAINIVKKAEITKEKIIADANEQVKLLIEKAQKLERVTTAYENKINGYGDEYIIPIDSIIDQLAKELEYAEPSKQFQEAKKKIKTAIKNGEAAKSRLADESRREKALEFILDAFLGKAETIIAKVKSDNFGKLKQELEDSFILVNVNGDGFGTQITRQFLDLYQDKLKWASILQKMKKDQQEEQRKIREQMREEEKVRREAEKAQKDALKEEEAVQKALAIAYEKMAKASEEEKANYERQISELNQKVVEAEEKRQRAISMAQQTKMGHVYIISNVGSFGEDVFKIGLTRRLEPQDRIDELGDSSVPFEFDVHALIKSEDAPALEHLLHKHFVLSQVNKINHRKEFFKVPLSKIREEVEKMGLNATWTMTAEAMEFKESQRIEKLISADPIAKEKWISRQLELDDMDLNQNIPSDKGDLENDD